ncbi:uncharacterized protein LOC130267372 isoform X2 [Hyla sarda]|nr:uncharacterized protein LOC130267372 isoform X2 [Hyla sarda]
MQIPCSAQWRREKSWLILQQPPPLHTTRNPHISMILHRIECDVKGKKAIDQFKELIFNQEHEESVKEFNFRKELEKEIYQFLEHEVGILDEHATSEVVAKSATCLPPHSLPHHSLPPQSLPPHSLPPHSLPPHSLPPHSLPPHSLPPHSLPPHSLPPHSLPPHSLPPHSLPPESLSPHSLPPHSLPPESLSPQCPYKLSHLTLPHLHWN